MGNPMPPSWLARVGIRRESPLKGLIDDWIGTGFAINERCVLTCGHVIDQVFCGDQQVLVAFENGLFCVVEREQVHRHPQLDIALLEIDQNSPAQATLVVNQRGTELGQPDARYTAYGYPQGFGGQELMSETLTGTDLDRQRLTAECDGGLRFIKNTLALSEGFSGGPLVSVEHPLMPVLAINILGGQKAVVGGAYPVDLAVRFGFELSRRLSRKLYPKHLMDVGKLFDEVNSSSSGAALNQRNWSNLLGFESPWVTLSFAMNHCVYKERFVLVPPTLGSPAVWLQQAVVSAHMLNQSRDHLAAGRGYSYNQALRAVQAIADYFALPLHLPSVEEWRRGVSAEGEYNLAYSGKPLVPQREDASISRVGAHNQPFGLSLTPPGLYELLLLEEPKKPTQAKLSLLTPRVYSPHFGARGELDTYVLGPDECDKAVVFRMAVSAMVALDNLKPQWEESPYG